MNDRSSPTAAAPQIVSHDEWLNARRTLLLKEKALTRQRDALSAERRALPWVSSYGSDFNYDFNVSFTPEQLAARSALVNFRLTDPGLEDLSGDSVFFKDKDDRIFHTYSTFGRGGEEFLGIYRYLDAMPLGRNETGPYHSLGDWARPHDMYGKGGMVEGNGRYHAPTCGCVTAASSL